MRHLFFRSWLSFWSILVSLPIIVIALSFVQIDTELWAYLWDVQLPHLLLNTLWLILGVGSGVLILGVSLAWLVAMYDFPLRRFFFWALMLPISMPAYVMAFSLLGIFDYSGEINTFFREAFGWKMVLPELRNTGGTIAVLSLAFYPYVFLLARNAFCNMGRQSLEIGASFAYTPFQSFWKVVLPMSRPWLIGGMMLALMETLADFGTVSVFNYDTFTTAIYEAWYGFFSLETAQQLSSILIIFVFVLLLIEQKTRAGKRYAQKGHQEIIRKKLTGTSRIFAISYCCLILLLAVALPLIQLSQWAWESIGSPFNDNMWAHTTHSLMLGLITALLTAFVALLLTWAKRNLRNNRFAQITTRLATLGYGIPGTVLAVGVFIPIAALDNVIINNFMPDQGVAGIFKGTVSVMILAYIIRYMAAAFSATDAGMERISVSQEETARSLGLFSFAMLRRLYFPLMRGAMGTAMLMVFVDVMKEMPITLMMRPFNWDTLAVHIYNLTAEGHYPEAGLPSLILFAAGLLPVILFSKAEQ